MSRNNRRVKGFSTLELLISSSLMAIVLWLLVSAQITILNDWQRGVMRDQVTRDSHKAVRELRRALLETTGISVASDGTAVVFRYPQIDANGRFIIPIVAEANTRNLSLNWSSGQLTLTQNGNTTVLLRDIVNTDASGNTYRPFTLIQRNGDAATLHIRLAIRKPIANGSYARTWVEESILLRNLQ